MSINEWLFNSDPSKKLKKSPDTMMPAKRQLLNDHLDGLLTNGELQEKLRELRSGQS